MPKADLETTYVYEGSFYGPGEDVEMPEEVYEALKEKGAFEESEETADNMIDLFGEETAELLMSSGFPNKDAVREASDDALLDIDGVGPQRLKKIRAALR